MSSKSDATARMLRGFQKGDRVRLDHDAVRAYMAAHRVPSCFYVGIDADDLPRLTTGTVMLVHGVEVTVAWDGGFQYWVYGHHLLPEDKP